jgi:oligoribonuclease
VTQSSRSGSADRIVWIDCEMTGLDLVADALVEVAAVVTDSELNVLGDGIEVVIAPPAAALAQMTDFVRDMHTRSGLLEDLPGGMTMAEAQEAVLAYVREWVPEPRKAPLAGNSVGTDKTFLDRDMPELVEHLHYRVIDVSSIKELARRWYPRVYFASPEKHGGHRALADILESIDELRYYRAALLVPEPGPDSKAARAIAESVVATSVLGSRAGPAATGGTVPSPSLPPSTVAEPAND